MPSTSDFRNGLKIELDNEPFIIVGFQHVKPGKGGAFVRTKIKNLRTGRVLEKTFRSGESVGDPGVEQKQMQYLYRDGDILYFMDTQTYDQTGLGEEKLGDSMKLLREETIVDILFHKGDAISVEMPTFVELAIKKTEPGVRGDTATGATKQAEVETGATVTVPLFPERGRRAQNRHAHGGIHRAREDGLAGGLCSSKIFKKNLESRVFLSYRHTRG